MLRLSTLVAALTFLASVTIGASTAQAVVCSEQLCISNCFKGGGKRCLHGCDRRIARRMASGVCPWYGPNWLPGQQTPFGM